MKITFTITVDIDDQESVAKASEDNGVTTGAEADHVTGEASRLATGRTVAATSEIMDVTGGESAATNSPVTATRRVDGFGSVQDALKMSTNGPNASAAEQQNSTGKAVDTSLTVVGTESGTVVDLKPVVLRPHCQRPGAEDCPGVGRQHCYACRKAMNEEAA